MFDPVVAPMLNPVLEKQYQERFAAIESSFRLEGMDPIHDEVYREAKAQVLLGKMTPKQALAYVVKESAKVKKDLVESR